MKTLARLALLAWFNSANAQTFQYIYIEANEGSSSGGHVAVQFEDEVFHFQYTGSLTRLAKEEAEDFRFDYRYLQNRTLHVADIEVSPQTFRLLQAEFKRQFWDQERLFKHLQALENDRHLLEWLLALQHDAETVAAPKSLELAGAGLFYANRNAANIGDCFTNTAASVILNQLRQNIKNQFGDDFLTQQSEQLKLTIQQLKPENLAHDYGFFQHYVDLLTGLLALQVIQESRPLRQDACYELTAPEWRLDAVKTQTLIDYQQRLLKTSQNLLHSTRPDWGHALFVTLARLVIVEQSLQTGQWAFLDDFDPDAAIISTEAFSQQTREMESQRLLATHQWQELWQGLTLEKPLDDLGYAGLEIASNRYHEWQSSLQTHTLRYKGQQPLPDKAVPLSVWEIPNLSEQQLHPALIELQSRLTTLTAEIENRYVYNLISRNCVTEIFRTINQALGGETEQRLGSRIDPDLNFIPFTAFAYLQNHYPVTNTTVQPSFRLQQLARKYEEEFTPWVYARESNIFSAELYHYNPDDAAFIFFTDDGFLLRPLFGAFNTLTGIGQSLLGLIQWPVDEGAALHNGTRGLMMSLPELAFINIRKGSYKFDFSVNLSPQSPKPR